MWCIIIGIIIIYVIWNIFLFICGGVLTVGEFLSNAVGSKTFIITLVLCVIAFFAYSWSGVLVVAIGGLGIAYLLKEVGQALEKHDKNKKETAEINKNTQQAQAMQNNEFALRKELDENCRWLGFMNAEMWVKKLPNYKNKSYQSSFDNITSNFAKQMEQQNILQSDTWFEPFFRYILSHPQGTTPTKLLNEVSCPQLQITHITPNIKLLNAQLKKGTQRVSRDVPPLFDERPLEGMKENLYVPTQYALMTYGSSSDNLGTENKTEFDINDL